MRVLEQIELNKLTPSLLRKALAKLGEPAKALEDAGVICCARGEANIRRTAIWFADDGPQHEREEVNARHAEAVQAFCQYLKVPVPTSNLGAEVNVDTEAETETGAPLPPESTGGAEASASEQTPNLLTEPLGEPTSSAAPALTEKAYDSPAAARVGTMPMVEMVWSSDGPFPSGTKVVVIPRADFDWMARQAQTIEPLQQRIQRAIDDLTANTEP
jgi:mRNA-degrading endonuclease toxin of MazEF toxin-antitoxin module